MEVHSLWLLIVLLTQFVFLGLAAVFFAVLAVPAIFFAKFLQKLWSTRARNCTLGTIRAVLAGICREKRFFVFVKKNRRPTVILMLNHEALAHLISSGILYLLLLELGLPTLHHFHHLLTLLHLLQLLWHHLETRRKKKWDFSVVAALWADSLSSFR